MALLATLALVAGCTGGGRHHHAEAATHPEYTNPTVSAPVSALTAFGTKDKPTKRVQVSISHPEISYHHTAGHHIQSYIFYDRRSPGGGVCPAPANDSACGFQIFSENKSTTGRIYIAKGAYGGTKVTEFDVPTGYAHPGGMQIIGDYLLVALEKSDVGAVYMYDLTKLYTNPTDCCGTSKNQPPSTPVKLINTTGGSSASSVGVTNISGEFKYSPEDPNWDGTRGVRYVMAVHHYGKSVTLYISKPGVTLADAGKLDFKALKTFTTNRKYDSMALLAQPNDSVWMMGFTTEGSSNNDYADLVQLTNVSNHNVYFAHHAKPGNGLRTERSHFKTEHSSGGVYGVHFRWGPGLNIYPSDHLRLNVTEREWGTAPGRKVTVNWFCNWACPLSRP